MSYEQKSYGVSQWFNIDGTPVDAETKRRLDADYKALMQRQMARLKADLEEQIPTGAP
jgi:hypothetical protein